MIPHLQLLKYLLYMELGVAPHPLITQHAYIMESRSQLAFANRVCAEPAVTADEIRTIISHFGTTPFYWFIDEHDLSGIAQLQAQGFEKKTKYPAMILDMHTLKNQPYQNDVEIKKIAGEDHVQTWISLMAQSYALDKPGVEKFVRYLISNTAPENFLLYIGYYQGIPAATSAFIKRGSIMSMHLVGTLPEFRGKGLGFAVSHKPLWDAKNNGVEQCVLLASSMGKPIYEKIGFKEYAHYNVYQLKTLMPTGLC